MNVNVNKLTYVKEAKYLGVIICNDLNDDGDILRHKLRILFVIFMLDLIALSDNFTTVPWTSVSCILLYNLLLPIMG